MDPSVGFSSLNIQSVPFCIPTMLCYADCMHPDRTNDTGVSRR